MLQGDSFSPLLFCIAMALISHAINKMECGYATASGKLKNMQMKVSHLFYMDDLKLYGSSSGILTKMVEKVKSVSSAIGMKMNTKNCTVANFVSKRLLEETDVEPTQREGCLGFPTLDKGGVYKCLGIEQILGMKESYAGIG